MKISWVLLTYNRADVVSRAYVVNSLDWPKDIESEIIWVDNGSNNSDYLAISKAFILKNPSIAINNFKNIGVAKGYNQGMVLATGDYIVITGCDRIMPERWLDRMLEAFEKVPNMGCVSCYSEPEETIQDRYVTGKQIEEINGVQFMLALPFEARMFKRELLADVGYFHEGLGLYGYEDCLWGPRMMNVAKEKGLICCTLPNFKAVHLGRDDSTEYKEFKQRETKGEPWKWELVQKLAREGYPKFNPYL